MACPFLKPLSKIGTGAPAAAEGQDGLGSWHHPHLPWTFLAVSVALKGPIWGLAGPRTQKRPDALFLLPIPVLASVSEADEVKKK